MKIYLRLIMNVTYLLASLGIIMPFLFSASDDFLVAVGFVYTFSIPVVLYYANRAAIRNFKERINEV